MTTAKSSNLYLTSEQRRGISTLVVFGALESSLLSLHRAEIPNRDIEACKNATIFLLLAPMLIKWLQNHIQVVARKTQRFTTIFGRLSLAEVFFTVILPWARLILSGKAADTLAVSHLFIFQAQIVLESLIMCAGEEFKMLLFPFTCIANSYRLIPILLWLSDAYTFCTNIHGSTDAGTLNVCSELTLPAIAGLLWLYSSLIFIPFVWYPILRISRKSNCE